jgi:hypothetical protein
MLIMRGSHRAASFIGVLISTWADGAGPATRDEPDSDG